MAETSARPVGERPAQGVREAVAEGRDNGGRVMRICVVALGKIGLPLAVQFASMGHRVVGADVDERAVGLVNAGVAPFPGETDLDAKLGKVVAEGLLSATTDTASAIGVAVVDPHGRTGPRRLEDRR